MLRSARWKLSSLALTGTLLAACNSATTPTTPPQTTYCPFFLKEESPISRCGQLSVPANHADPGGQQFQLPYVVFSTRATPSKNATVVLQGGPGSPSATIAQTLQQLLTQVQLQDDIIVFDQRGAGASQPRLNCVVTPTLAFTDPQQLSQQADTCLRQAQGLGLNLADLNTRASADDVALLAKKLGYEQLNLYGMSYGTRLAQEIVRRHPTLVRSQVLDGVIDPQATWFVNQTRDMHDTLLRFGAACMTAGRCPAGTNLPARMQEAATVVDGAHLTYSFSYTGDLSPQPISGELMLMAFQRLGYSPQMLQSLPARLDAILRRDAGAIATLPSDALALGSMISWPIYPAVICQDSRLDETSIQAAYTGLPPVFQKMSTLTRTLANFCAQAGLTAPAETLMPVTANIPTLVISGRFDAVTTVNVAEQVAARFKPSQHVIFEAGGHVNGTTTCGLQLLLTFLNNPAAPLNVACAAQPLTWLP